MDRPLKDKRPFGPILDFSQSRRPFTSDGEEIIFRPSLNLNRDYPDVFSVDPLKASEYIKVFLNSLENQQPELNVAGSEIIVKEVYDGDDISGYDIAIPMRKPVLVFSHIEDAIYTMHNEVDNKLIPGDHVILPKSEVRNQLDEQMDMGLVRTTFGAETIL